MASPTSGREGSPARVREKASGEIVSNSPEETFEIGRRMASSLLSGDVVELNGELGSGKTYLTKGVAFGLGINENVTSPTYTIISEYQGICPFYHIDAYRLNDEKDFQDLGGDEIINGDGISVIEWGEKIPKSLPKNKITVNLKITGLSSRLIRVEGIEIHEPSRD